MKTFKYSSESMRGPPHPAWEKKLLADYQTGWLNQGPPPDQRHPQLPATLPKSGQKPSLSSVLTDEYLKRFASNN